MHQRFLGFTHESLAKTYEWYTPPHIFVALGLTFDLDPASPLEGPLPWIPARRHFTKADDGLMQPWAGRVWLNPPYGKYTAEWMRRFARHGDGIALVFARTDTEWFHRAMESAWAVCFIRGRIHFMDREQRTRGASGAGSVLIACGLGCAEAVLASRLGWVVALRNAQAQA